MTIRVLEEAEVWRELKDFPGWNYKEQGKCSSIHRRYEFPTFERAISFMGNCVPIINEKDHHPEWTNVYNRLEVKYTTHDAGNVVTEKDIEMAKELEKIYQRNYSKK